MKKVTISKITAQEILDSRGNPTVRAVMILSDGSQGVASVPSGASTGTHEALELRDGGARFGGKGVLKAIKNIETIIAKRLVGLEAGQQNEIDLVLLKLDGTTNKSKLGANAILAVSLAHARAAAVSTGQPLYKWIRNNFKLPEKKWLLPIATMNIINGGRHANNGLSIQEFMIVPIHKKMSERIRIGAEVFHALAGLLGKKGFTTGVGDEGGFAPSLPNNEQAIKLIMQAIKEAGYTAGKQVLLAMDFAASEFFRAGKYYFDNPQSAWTAEQMIELVGMWQRRYPIISIEDPLAEDDWQAWEKLTKRLGKDLTIVGDDLFVTNVKRIQIGLDKKAANAVLIKLNQIGTLSETIAAIYLAKQHKYKVSVSHRSAETADTFIADLAVAVNAEFIKTGSLSRSERTEKYNRLMEIETELG